MADLGLQIQTAVVTALKAAGLTVYDKVPQGSAYPYVTVARQVRQPDEAIEDRRYEVFIYLQIWSRAGGQFEVLQTLETLRATLHLQRLSLATGAMLRGWLIRAETSRDSDNQTFGGQATLRVLADR